MTRFAVVVSLLVLPALADTPTDHLLRGVQERYNRARTLQVLFSETYSVQSRLRRPESGQLSLRKPGRMRWDYTAPKGKLFLSDGKNVYLYTPNANRVEKMKLKESEDLRAPLAFLLGRLDFHKDFAGFQTRMEGPDTLVIAQPKSEKLPYSEVEFLVTPEYRIKRLVVKGQDQSVLTFAFDQERVNPELNDRLFRFELPAGAELVDSSTEPDKEGQ